MTATPRQRSLAGLVANLLLVMISLLIGLMAAEALIRLWKGEPVFAWPDYSRTVVGCATAFDPYAGWKPVPSMKGLNREKRPVTILPTGLRSNGGPPVESDRRILAVGDSYTFGDQVGDAETWPAALERRLGIQVLNGGVCGYGVGQTVLRSQELTPVIRPDILLVGMIPTNIWRAQASGFYSKSKPYFSLENAVPVLKNVPLVLPEPPTGIAGLVGRGYDYIHNHSLFIRSLPDVRSRLSMYRNRAYTEAHQQGLEVSCKLIGQVRDMADSYGARPYLLMLYKYRDIGNRMKLEGGASPEPGNRNLEFLSKALELMECSRSAGVPVIDTFRPFEALHRKGGDAAVAEMYFDHMNAAGNEFIAGYIAGQLRQITD